MGGTGTPCVTVFEGKRGIGNALLGTYEPQYRFSDMILYELLVVELYTKPVLLCPIP